MKPRLRYLLSAFLIASSSQVVADGPRLRFSGFGTLGYVATDSSDVVYHRVAAQDGADHKGSLEVDSRIGVQANAELSSRYSATDPILAREDADGDFTPGVEWAFAKAQLTPTVSLRVGRIGAPVFMVSDFREVGYANTLLRPPEDTYAQIPIRTFDGVDVIDQFELGVTLLKHKPSSARERHGFHGTKKHLQGHGRCEHHSRVRHGTAASGSCHDPARS